MAGMNKLVSMELPPRYPRPTATSTMNQKLVDDKFKKIEISSQSSGENPSSGPSIKLELENLYQHKWIRKFDPNMDPKKLRRLIGNRLSVQKNRLRKLEYSAQLEQNVNNLKEFISLMASQVSQNECKHSELSIENDAIRDRIAKLSDEQRLKQIENKLLNQEKHRWLDIFQQQQLLNNNNPFMNLAKCNLGQEKLFNINPPMNQAEQLYNMNNPMDQAKQLFNINYSMNLIECKFGQEQLFNINNPMNLAEFKLIGEEQLSNINNPMDLNPVSMKYFM
ncbi:basic leucine zipper 61-like [Telopea speciosissima]|uniref:basic leucine zipper 61-like n=1 Tax=Telopea speciosissima TaxID=54955 RepID=UPI001CC54394|nr:basic leucine zipper 61-like [Telopea speciosissima]